MGRLKRFADFRFIGLRDTMLVYDCDDEGSFSQLENRVSQERLDEANMVQTFAPDSEEEAANRCFRPAH